MLHQWVVDGTVFFMGLGVDLAHAYCGLSEHSCFFSYLTYQTRVAITGRILLSAIGPIAKSLQDEALISRLSSLCTMASVVPKALLPSQGVRHMS